MGASESPALHTHYLLSPLPGCVPHLFAYSTPQKTTVLSLCPTEDLFLVRGDTGNPANLVLQGSVKAKKVRGHHRGSSREHM